jgi:hypothetical protein
MLCIGVGRGIGFHELECEMTYQACLLGVLHPWKLYQVYSNGRFPLLVLSYTSELAPVVLTSYAKQYMNNPNTPVQYIRVSCYVFPSRPIP